MDHIEDRMELKALVDKYATESDKNNQDCYVDIFRPDVKLDVYFGGKLGMQARDVQDMIRQYKAFGAAKVSFHMNGQQNVDFSDDTHATGTCYALASLVTEKDGKDVLAVLDFSLTDADMAAIATLDKGVRYYNRTDEQLVQFAAWQPTYEKA